MAGSIWGRAITRPYGRKNLYCPVPYTARCSDPIVRAINPIVKGMDIATNAGCIIMSSLALLRKGEQSLMGSIKKILVIN
jgi:hypothetical protein